MTRTEKIKFILSCIDLTSLEATDHEQSISALIQKANRGYNGIHPAAVCVFPKFAEQVKGALKEPIKTAVVAGYFPSGQATTSLKCHELETINLAACNEVDIVINRGEFLAGNYDYVSNELRLMRNQIPSKTLKVILETGELKTAENIARASQIAIDCGAAFIKTSTGKIQAGAAPADVETMCGIIKNHFIKTGKKTGIKPSGGIREIKDALLYCDLVSQVCGEEWLNPSLFRIGASALYDRLISELSVPNE